jgi:ABC-type polysaccharide/polyol phosphate transport system ATPase subunit
MATMNAIELQNVSKSFPRHNRQLLLRDRISLFLKGRHRERFYALKNVSFHLPHGESLAIVGPNGAGKSTLLGVIAGLAHPDEGSATVNGRVAALLELGSGFHPDLTGKENVRLNASLLGLSRARTDELYDGIVEFSGIGDFINETVRTYSSGMVLRLAFSVAINMDPEILLVDEVLTVGDQAFQAKCVERIHEFRNSGKSIIAVSHAQGMVQELCDHAIWLDHGEVVMSGDIQEVTDAYAGRQRAATISQA